MKYILIATILLSSTAFSQKILVPYRDGNLFGLSDDKGKIIVAPAYAHMSYLQDNFFTCSNDRIVTVNMMGSGNVSKQVERKAHDVGLFLNDKLLIPLQEKPSFIIYGNLIAASENPYHAENCSLYNIKGEKLLENVRGLYVNDKRDVGTIYKKSSKYSLISVYERDEERNRVFSLAVYDNEKQKISKWLLRKVYEFNATAAGRNGLMMYTYKDAQLLYEKYPVWINDQFELRDENAIPAEERNQVLNENSEVTQEMVADVLIDGSYDSKQVVQEPYAESPETLTESQMYSRGMIKYQIRKDSLFYIRPGSSSYISLPKGTTLITAKKASMDQQQSMIYKKGHQYGLVIKGIAGPLSYDSLAYFGKNYKAWQRTGDKIKCGTINNEGNIKIPLSYDSINQGIKRLELDYDRLSDNHDDFLTIKNPLYDERLTVFNNGKAGILTENNELLIPVEYDTIISNEVHFSREKFTSKFLILKKNGLYGIADIDYNYRSDKYEIKKVLAPAFKAIPVYYFKDYFGKKDYDLFGFFDWSYHFIGYADRAGVLFYKD